MQLPSSKKELKEFFQKEEFIIQTCQQISKDLAGLIAFEPNLDIDLEENVLDQLILRVSEILTRMDGRHLQQFIYRVDLKEQDYLSARAQEDEEQLLAHLIIRREAQKVFIKAHFS